MRRELLFRSGTTAAQLLGGREKAALEIELRESFAECDPDANGVLDIEQFRRCLESATLGLTPRQVVALVNVADINDDGQIDYFEFVRFAFDVLLTLAREEKLQQMLDAQQ
jgi:Ca2+-binding EF-hand superfamily protein